MTERARTVLVLDRDERAAADLARVVEAHGYRVVGLVHSVGEARRLAASARPDVALLAPQAGEPHGEDLRLAVELERAGTGVVLLAPALRPDGEAPRGPWRAELLLHALDAAYRTRRAAD